MVSGASSTSRFIGCVLLVLSLVSSSYAAPAKCAVPAFVSAVNDFKLDIDTHAKAVATADASASSAVAVLAQIDQDLDAIANAEINGLCVTAEATGLSKSIAVGIAQATANAKATAVALGDVQSSAFVAIKAMAEARARVCECDSPPVEETTSAELLVQLFKEFSASAEAFAAAQSKRVEAGVIAKQASKKSSSATAKVCTECGKNFKKITTSQESSSITIVVKGNVKCTSLLKEQGIACQD